MPTSQAYPDYLPRNGPHADKSHLESFQIASITNNLTHDNDKLEERTDTQSLRATQARKADGTAAFIP